MKKPPDKALSNLEHQLMEILWKGGPATADQIREALAPRHSLKDSTIRTVLRRLQEKGYIDHKIVGKAFVYSGIEKPRNVAVRAVRQILDRFCDGSLEQLMLGLVENEVVDRAELQQLARKLGKHRKETSKMLPHLADVSIRSLVLALVALVVLCALGSRRTAALQHAVWAAVVCGMLALLAFGQALPRFPLQILDRPAAAPLELAPPIAPAPPVEETLELPLPVPSKTQRSIDWSEVALYAYAAIAFAFLARFAMGMFLVRRLLARSKPGEAGFLESELIAVPLTVGWLRPKILLPMEWREWDREKWDAVLTHEGAHVRRRDGLVSALAGINRCIFWFHPLAWMLERRLRLLAELACDESSVATLGDREGYARLLLEMARVVDGTHGRLQSHALTMTAPSHLRRRVDSILREQRKPSRGLTWTGWAAVTLCGIPVVLGAGGVELAAPPPFLQLAMPAWKTPVPPVLVAQGRPAPPSAKPAPRQEFEVASIRPCEGGGWRDDFSPGRITVNCSTLKGLVQRAYDLYGDDPFLRHMHMYLPIEGGQDWTNSELFNIIAKAEGSATKETTNGPMLQALLEDRFKLKLHRETRQVQVYELTVSKGGLKLQKAQDSGCVPYVMDSIPPAGKHFCDREWLSGGRGNATISFQGASMKTLAKDLSFRLGRPVIDKTGIAELFDFHLEFMVDESTPTLHPNPEFADQGGTSIFTAIQEQLGLKLVSTKGPGEVLVIDSVERPSEN